MKKNDVALIVGSILMLIVAFFMFGETNANPEVKLPLSLSGEEIGAIEISYSDYKSKVENNDNFIIVIERTGCSYCEMYLPVLSDVTAELSIPVYYIDTAKLTEDEYNELSKTNSYLKRNKWGTPTTLLMSGKIVVDSISGYVEKEEFIEEIIEENVILSQDEPTGVE